MTLPGQQVISRESPPSSGISADTGAFFIVGMTEKGPLDAPVLVRNLVQAKNALGARVNYGFVYDALDVFFREGGSEAYVGRVGGPAPVTSTATLTDGTNPTLTVRANSPGAWGNDLSITVLRTGSNFTITVNLLGVAVEVSPLLATADDAIVWAVGSRYIVLTDAGIGGDPANATTTLTGGTDDHVNATETQWLNALNLFSSDLGPGQVAAPGRTTATIHANLLAHAQAKDRIALLDLADSGDAATLIAAAATDRVLDTARYGGAFAPWAIVPGVSIGTTRTVPYSAVEAGVIARLEASGRTPNEAAAGVNGRAQYAIGLSQPAWDDSNRELLNDAGVNVVRVVNGSVEAYGYRTLVNPSTQPDWIELSNSRLYMAIASEAGAIAERFVFAQLDGRGKKISEFGGELVGMLIPFYEAGALYGDTFRDAAQVDVGSQVNTPETIAAQQLNAAITVRMSPFAERVTIEITKIANTEVI